MPDIRLSNAAGGLTVALIEMEERGSAVREATGWTLLGETRESVLAEFERTILSMLEAGRMELHDRETIDEAINSVIDPDLGVAGVRIRTRS